MINQTPHPLAGQTVRVCVRNAGSDDFADFVVGDWLDRAIGVPWFRAIGNAEVGRFAYRAGLRGLPQGNALIHGTINGTLTVIHETEIVDPATLPACLGCRQPVETLDHTAPLCPDCTRIEQEADPYRIP